MVDDTTVSVEVQSCNGEPEVVEAERTATEIRIEVVATTYPEGDDCQDSIEIDLDEPLGSRAVVDATTGERLASGDGPLGATFLREPVLCSNTVTGPIDVVDERGWLVIRFDELVETVLDGDEGPFRFDLAAGDVPAAAYVVIQSGDPWCTDTPSDLTGEEWPATTGIVDVTVFSVVAADACGNPNVAAEVALSGVRVTARDGTEAWIPDMATSRGDLATNGLECD